jgi:hypothetical protein
MPKSPDCRYAPRVPPDLRTLPCDEILTRVQKTLHTTFDPVTEVRKRRSVGFRTTNNTWVRIEVRDLSRMDGQGWGTESAALLHGIAMPTWFQGISWLDAEHGVMWRADETDYIRERPIKAGGILTADPELPESWWATLNESLDALANQSTARIATPTLQPITQDRLTSTVHTVFPGVDTAVPPDEWAPAHADLSWPNLTAPACYLLDWEDFGMAPRGWDAATLWSESLAAGVAAERVRQERRGDMDSRTGTLAQLYQCAKLIAAGHRSGPLLAPAQAAAAALLHTVAR